MRKYRSITAIVSALLLTANFLPFHAMPVSAKYGTGLETVERLNRGISAVNTGSGMLVSWRFNADDADNTEFQLYRDNVLIYTSPAGRATCYLDRQGTAKSQYRVDTLVNGQVLNSEICSLRSDKSWMEIPLDIPKGGSDYGYRANDCSCGDVDGDGEYEIILKWDPTNSQDNSKSGYTGNVYLDCYKLSGKKLWRIDLGKNIRAGAHYTQFLVADFDLDGKAELTCKTADGTIDGIGKVIGDASKDYRNPGGYILDGSEYYTLFDGQTGAALDTVPYEYPRGDVSKWGDKYGNRVDRFLGAVMYCDGVHPSAVSVRGYYTRMTAVCYDVINKKLVKRWGYDSGNTWSENSGFGNGNHNAMPGDMDGDGKQELLLGAVALDDDGSVLWSNNKGHGDAMHLGDLVPERPGLEAWVCHEHTPWGVSLLDAKTGNPIFHYDHSKDTGRCCAGNIYAGNPGCEFWGPTSGDVFNSQGKGTGIERPSMNFLCYWDGDLESELLSDTSVSKINANKKIDYLLWAEGCVSCNSTKATPCLSADLFGDWREEIVWSTADSKYLRIYATPYTTDYRITTLMHDPQYRMQTACEQSGYNQPPHTSFYLGSDQPLPERPAVTVLGAEQPSSETPQPNTEPTETNYHTGQCEDFILGDLNHDGIVNIYDFILMKKEIQKPLLTRSDRYRADINADGKISMEDVGEMQKFLHHKGSFKAHEEKRSFRYAIDETWNEGITENTNAGFQDKAYINLDNKTGSFLEWHVNAPVDGNYLCTFGIANGSKNNRSMKIEVNNQKDFWMQDFLTTNSWTNWEERGIVLPLKAGENTIRMTSATAEGGPNFDYLKTEWTDEPIAEIYTEPQKETEPIQQVSSRTVYIAGDSTVQTYNAKYAPQQGWGAFLNESMPQGVAVSNHAIAGRSSKSFYDNGRLNTILEKIQKNDYLLIQFGINDSAASKAERYAPTCGQIPGTAGSFEDYMSKYIEGAKARGATPVLITTVLSLKSYKNGRFENSYQNYCDAMKKLSAYYQIPCIDLNSLMVQHYNTIGYDAAYQYHMCSTGSTDMTHFTETGAKAVAKLVADEMIRQKLV